MKKVLLISFVFICFAMGYTQPIKPTEKVTNNIITFVSDQKIFINQTMTTKPETKMISVIGVGDIMLGSSYPSSSYLPPNNENILKGVENILQKADIVVGNLEGAILDKGNSVKNCSECFSFRMPCSYASYLKQAGFTFLGTANNHSMDFGETGRNSTIQILQVNGINFAGYSNMPAVSSVVKNGLKIGFCSFGPNGYSGIYNFKDANKIIKEASLKNDILIVNFHVGAEGSNYQHVSNKEEYFLGEDRGNPIKLAREAIDNGADIVFMEGPHVTRAIDIYKGRFVAYSLGDFATYGQFNTSGVYGIAPIIKIFVDCKGTFHFGQIYSIKLKGKGIPVIDKSNSVIQKIIELTNDDFHNSQLIIKKNGEITIKTGT